MASRRTPLPPSHGTARQRPEKQSDPPPQRVCGSDCVRLSPGLYGCPRAIRGQVFRAVRRRPRGRGPPPSLLVLVEFTLDAVRIRAQEYGHAVSGPFRDLGWGDSLVQQVVKQTCRQSYTRLPRIESYSWGVSTALRSLSPHASNHHTVQLRTLHTRRAPSSAARRRTSRSRSTGSRHLASPCGLAVRPTGRRSEGLRLSRVARGLFWARPCVVHGRVESVQDLAFPGLAVHPPKQCCRLLGVDQGALVDRVRRLDPVSFPPGCWVGSQHPPFDGVVEYPAQRISVTPD